jgi:ribA/ribD-fused uncharacterized protein
MTVSTAINEFRGDFDFLNSAYPANVEFDGEMYPSIEHAFQAAKTMAVAERAAIRTAPTAAQAKSLGRKLSNLDPDWDTNRLTVMQELVKRKFTTNLNLKLKLLLTGQQDLIQGGMWRDQFWGVDQSGQGENHLGKILMAVREEIRTSEGNAEKVFCQFLASNGLEFMSTQLGDMFTLLKAAASDNPDGNCAPTLRDSVLRFVEGLQ